MTKPVTFFFERGRNEATTHEFAVGYPQGKILVFVYANGSVKRSLVEDQRLKKEDDIQFVIRDLKQALSSVGGLIVAIGDRGRQRDLLILPVEARGVSPARRFMMVRPGLSPVLKNIGKEWQEVPSTAHLIVPVDATSEEHLQSFQEYLSWFPEDFETVVLYALMRPTLDDRLSTLERQAFGRTAVEDVGDKAAGRFRRTWRALRRWAWRPVPQVPAIATALAFLLGINALLLYGVTLRLDRVSGQPILLRPRILGGEPRREPDVAEATNMAEGVRKVVEAVQARSNDIPRFGDLYRMHFKPAEGKDLAAGLASAGKEAWAKPLLFGIVKLEALSLDPGQKDLSFLAGREWDNYTDTKAVFQALTPTLEANDQARGLLAALACLTWSNPRIPGTGTPAFAFAPPGKTCQDFPPEQSVSGLEELATFVEDYNPPAQLADQAR